MNPKHLEIIHRDDGFVETRYWTLSSTAYDGKVVSLGKICSAVIVEDKDGNEVNVKPLISVDIFVEDPEFYSNMIGIDATQFLGLDSDTFCKEINRRILQVNKRSNTN